MFDASSARVVLLAVVVVLAFAQPVPSSTADDRSTGAATAGGDVGPTIGSTVQRHPSSAGATADALRSVRADAVHDRGLTGSNVEVGVIGRGFDADDRVMAPHVVEHRRIGGDPGSTAHDTAVAEVVSETAPSADLYLAGVGRTPTPEEYATAVEWLTDQGVDVVVDSGSYFPSVAGDGSRITAAAEAAAAEGVVFVTSAGNYADRHWAGTGTADGWVSFAEGDAANHLADGERVRGRVTARLRWQSAADYDLYLYRRLPNAPDRVVAKSTADETGPGVSVEGIDVAVPQGRYYLAVYADDPVATPGRVQVFAANHGLEHATAHGSMVAPATSDRVVAVGAAANGERAAYSSLSENGTVDLLAPANAGTRATELAGTSAAAPYVAGTAALMASGDRDPSPERVETILERTADGDDGPIDALAAVEATRGADRPAAGADGPATDAGVDASTAATADRAASTAAAERPARNRSDDGTRNATRDDGRDDESVRPDGSNTADGEGTDADGGRSGSEDERSGRSDDGGDEARDDRAANGDRRRGGDGRDTDDSGGRQASVE
ncbi:subtilase protease [Haloplanus rallus]|uniref:Subtilase protease n=1 Tax=Haloplanus rallus TaxID=1816183 RepID=A0A6B9FFX2_9EURY|nr:S8 family serine peptidase [Haloplanus rallus]QGX96250.1 subtilase protease [Haloplanus rallus]